MVQKNKVIDDFWSYLAPRMGNTQTACNYLAQINKFLKEYYKDCDVSEIISDEKSLLENGIKFIHSNLRVYNRKYALKKFFIFLGKSSLVDLLPKDIPQVIRRNMVKRIRFSDIKKIVDNAKDDEFKLLILLQYTMGARIGAVLKIKLQDIYLDKREGLYRISMQEKGGVLRTVYLDLFTSKYLSYYVKTHKIKSELFTKGYQTMYKRSKKLTKELFLGKLGKNISSHWFRHSRIMDLVDKGYRIEDIQKLTNHKSLDSLRRYMEEAGVDTKLLAKKEAPRW